MYLGHFGLSEQPFAHSSITDFFYEGANRGATLDALIYILTHGEGPEGVIRVTGDAGSGKTTLCQALMKRLPGQMQAIYLAKPALSPEEFLHLIADELLSLSTDDRATENLATAGQTPATIDEVQRLLAAKHDGGGRIVLLVDEAHAMPVETLEEALRLYDLESSCHKLLQVVLFGQSELKNVLALPQIRKFKDRFSHHLILQPLNARAVEEYLMCRVRAAGYHGSGIFSPGAVRLITSASRGLIPRLDILADKSMLAASVVKVREIKACHVKTAGEASGIETTYGWGNWQDRFGLSNRPTVKASIVLPTLAAAVLAALGGQALRPSPAEVASIVAPAPLDLHMPVPASVPMPAPVYPATVASMGPGTSSSVPARVPPPSMPPEVVAGASAPAQDKPTAEEPRNNAKLNIAGVKLAEYELLKQRVEETMKTVAKADKNFYTVQLFATNNVQPDRMERFLARARGLIDLSNLYVHTVKDGEQAKFRVTYGIYTSEDEATIAMAGLPPKYQSDFHPELYTLSELR